MTNNDKKYYIKVRGYYADVDKFPEYSLGAFGYATPFDSVEAAWIMVENLKWNTLGVEIVSNEDEP